MKKTFCSGIPRMKMQVESCCEQHDQAYTHGTSRLQADQALYQCLKRERPVFACVAYVVVRVFGWLFYKR
jgi:hypothetical protein